MKAVLYISACFCFAAPSAWQTLSVDRQFTVEMPASVTELNLALVSPGGKLPDHTRAWMANSIEGRCIVTRVPNAHHQRVAKENAAQRDAFYKQVVGRAIAQEAAPHVVSSQYFTTAEGSGVEVTYVVSDEYSKARHVRSMRSLVLDSVTYNLIFRPSNPTDSLASASSTQRRFFSSIQVKP